MALMTVMPSGTSTLFPAISIDTMRGFNTSGWSMIFCVSVLSVAIHSHSLAARRVLCNCVNDPIQRGTGTHGLGRLLIVRMIVPADILRPALRRQQLLIDLCNIVAQIFGDLRKPLCDLFIGRLCSQGLRPVQRQVEMAAPVVDLTYFTSRRLVALEELCVGLVQRIGEDLGHLIVSHLRQMLERGRERQE